MTEKYPDLVSLVPQIRGEGVSSFILEGEVVAVDQATGDLQPFQTLTNRAKKNVEIGTITVDVCLFSFDLMYLNGEPLLDRPFRERRGLLRSLFVEIPNKFTWVKSIDATSVDSEIVLEFFKSATDTKCEGIMVKVLDNTIKINDLKESTQAIDVKDIPGNTDQQTEPSEPAKPTKEKSNRRKALLSTYEPDKRLESWLKVKKDYSTSSETLDLIPVAGWHGQGRKAKWWSPILLAVRNPESGVLEAVTKCMSGFTDKFYQANKDKYTQGSPNVISRPNWVQYYGEPDIWFEPQEVWEMAFADITLSPTYPAAIGLVSEERGLSLRFPRFLRVRDDKSIEEATTSDYLALLWRKQADRTKDAPEQPEQEE
jgi:DNA ligase-1